MTAFVGMARAPKGAVRVYGGRVGRQRAIKPACRAPGNKEDGGDRLGQMLATVRWGRTRSPVGQVLQMLHDVYINVFTVCLPAWNLITASPGL